MGRPRTPRHRLGPLIASARACSAGDTSDPVVARIGVERRNPRRKNMPQAIVALIAALAAIAAAPAHAQGYPSRPAHIIVPFAAGGPSDLDERVLGEKLPASLGPAVVVQ